MKKIASMNKREVLETLNKLSKLQNKLLTKLADSNTNKILENITTIKNKNTIDCNKALQYLNQFAIISTQKGFNQIGNVNIPGYIDHLRFVLNQNPNDVRGWMGQLNWLVNALETGIKKADSGLSFLASGELKKGKEKLEMAMPHLLPLTANLAKC